jgi:maltose alpha-D-glucosyltransferase/alpha-amylase
MLGGDRRRLELANSVLMALPGAPVIRYGDEIGMGEDLSLKERDAVRTPMQWTSGPNAGFSTAKRLVHPVISEGPYSYERVNVELQRRDPHSLFNWMVKMIRVRKECPEIAWGDWTLLPTGSRSVLAMCFSWRGNRVVTLHNFSNQPQRVQVKVPGPGSERLIDLLNANEFRGSKRGAHRLALPAFGYRWYRVGTLNYALTREQGGPGITD